MRIHTLLYHSIRYRHYVRLAVRITFWLTVASLVGYGAYYAMTSYTEAADRVAKAEADKQELLDVLNGKLAMVDTEHGSRYAVVERVTWEVVNGSARGAFKPNHKTGH